METIKAFFVKYGKLIIAALVGLVGIILLVRKLFSRDPNKFNHDVGVLEGKSESVGEQIKQVKSEIKNIKPKELSHDDIEDYWDDTLK